MPKGKLPPQGAGAAGNAAPLPLASNSAAASSQEPAPAAQGGPDYCPGGSEAECINFCPPEDKVCTILQKYRTCFQKKLDRFTTFHLKNFCN